MKLSLTLPHHEGETITSFVSRVAYRNGYDRAGIFCADTGMDWKAIIRGDDNAFGEVAALTGAASGLLRRSSVRSRKAGKMLIGDEVGTHTLIKKSAPRVCPACLVEGRSRGGRFGGAGQVIWTVLAIHRCHLHGQQLVTLDTNATPVMAHDLHPIIRKNWPVIEASAGAAAMKLPETVLERYLRQRIAGVKNGIWPDGMTLYVAARTAEMLGCRILFGPEQSFRKLNADQMRDAGAAGFDALADGPQGLRDALRGFESSAHEVRAYHHRDYGRFFTWLSASRTSSEFDPIRDIVRDHILAQYPREEGAIVLGKPVSSRKLYTIEAARRALNIGAPRLKKLLHDRGICTTATDRKSGGNPPVLTTEQFAALRSEFDLFISASEAATMLGTTADQIRKLMAAGILTSGRHYGRMLLCPRAQVEELCAMIEKLPVGRANGYQTAASYLARGISTAELIRRFRDGNLRARRIVGGADLSSLIFCEDRSKTREDLGV